MIVSAIESGAGSMEEILNSAYSDVPEKMRPYAELALRAHLIKLGEIIQRHGYGHFLQHRHPNARWHQAAS